MNLVFQKLKFKGIFMSSILNEAVYRVIDITPEDLKSINLRVSFTHLRLSIKDVKNLNNIRLIEQQDKYLKSKTEINKEDISSNKLKISSTGGKTICTILNENDEIICKSSSICHPTADNFNKRIGRLKAFSSAIRELKLNNNDIYKLLQKEMKSIKFRPKLPSSSNKVSIFKIKSVINQIEEDLSRNDENISNLSTRTFIDALLYRLEK